MKIKICKPTQHACSNTTILLNLKKNDSIIHETQVGYEKFHFLSNGFANILGWLYNSDVT